MFLTIIIVYSLIVVGTILVAVFKSNNKDLRVAYHVRSAESKNAGAKIPGASEDCARIAKLAKDKVKKYGLG